MKTTVVGIRLNDYQREKLRGLCKKDEKESDVIKKLVNDKIDGKLLDCTEVIRAAKKRKIDPQRFLDEIGKELAKA